MHQFPHGWCRPWPRHKHHPHSVEGCQARCTRHQRCSLMMSQRDMYLSTEHEKKVHMKGQVLSRRFHPRWLPEASHSGQKLDPGQPFTGRRRWPLQPHQHPTMSDKNLNIWENIFNVSRNKQLQIWDVIPNHRPHWLLFFSWKLTLYMYHTHTQRDTHTHTHFHVILQKPSLTAAVENKHHSFWASNEVCGMIN